LTEYPKAMPVMVALCINEVHVSHHNLMHIDVDAMPTTDKSWVDLLSVYWSEKYRFCANAHAHDQAVKS
jgi:hypothetical protein